MLLGQIFNSMSAWQKLAGLTMKPFIAYQVLKYSKLVSAEYALADTQRIAVIHEITNTKDGEDAKIEPNTPEFTQYIERLNEVMTVESELQQFAIPMEDVVKAIGDNDNALTVQDLALLEPFFKTE